MDALIEALGAEGTLESQGRFTVDTSRLRERYQTFQQERSFYYLIRLVQGLVSLNPDNIEVHIGRRELTLKAYGLPHPTQIHPVTTWLDGASALSQGLLTCFLRDYANVELGLSDGRLWLGKDGSYHLHPTPGYRGELEIVLRSPPRLTFLDYIWSSGRHLAACHQMLSTEFASCPIPIKLDGRQINSSLFIEKLEQISHLVEWQLYDWKLPRCQGVWGDLLPGHRYHTTDCPRRGPAEVVNAVRPAKPGPQDSKRSVFFYREDMDRTVLPLDGAVGSCRAVLALRCDVPNYSLIHFVDRGMVVESFGDDIGCPGLVGFVSASDLAKDASGLRLVRDDAFERTLQALQDEVARAYQKYSRLPFNQQSRSGLYQTGPELTRASFAYADRPYPDRCQLPNHSTHR